MKLFFLFLSPFLFTGCSNTNIPGKQYYQFYSKSDVAVQNDSIICSLNNPLDCPLRIYIATSDSQVNKSLLYLYPIIVRARKDTLIRVKLPASTLEKVDAYWRTALGDPGRAIVYNKVSLPFCKGKEYKVIQGYNGQFSHITSYDRYAIDFSLPGNDTICAADDGIVIGVIKDYNVGGNDRKLENFANFITIYHPHSGLYTQYVHLKYNGSLVKVGDSVTVGQAIGLVGLTGFADRAHLHFNVLIPTTDKDALMSVPIEFVEHYSGFSLKPNDVVKK